MQMHKNLCDEESLTMYILYHKAYETDHAIGIP